MEDGKRLLELLERLGKDAQQQGSYRRLSLRLDRHPGWFSKVLNGQTQISARDLFQVLEKLDLRPSVFFGSLYRNESTPVSTVLAYLNENDGVPPSEFLYSVCNRAKEIDWTCLGAIPAETVTTLEELRVTPDPAASLPRVEVLIKAAMHRGHAEYFLASLNVWSSLMRELGRRTDAAKACIAAFQVVERGLDVGWLEGWLFQRSSYLLRDAQRLAEAEDFLREAADVFLLNGEPERFWTTYVDRGALYGHLGDFARSKLSFEVALRNLPSGMRRQRSACFQGIAQAHVHQGQLDDAEEALQQAIGEADGAEPHIIARLLWCRATLRQKQKRLDEAERDLVEVFNLFEEAERPIDRALVAVDLASLFLVKGDERKLRRLVEGVFRWLPLFQHHPTAQAAIAVLFRKSIAGELTEAVCHRVRAELKRPAPLSKGRRRRPIRP